jgi:hypothetical protein
MKKLSEALWAHKTSTPFEIVYGQEMVLPMEIGLQSLRVTKQGSLSGKECDIPRGIVATTVLNSVPLCTIEAQMKSWTYLVVL